MGLIRLFSGRGGAPHLAPAYISIGSRTVSSFDSLDIWRDMCTVTFARTKNMCNHFLRIAILVSFYKFSQHYIRKFNLLEYN